MAIIQYIYIYLIFTACLVIIGFCIDIRSKIDNNKFYDYNGNIIPNDVVRIYVADHFTYITHEDSLLMNQYFFVNESKTK